MVTLQLKADVPFRANGYCTDVSHQYVTQMQNQRYLMIRGANPESLTLFVDKVRDLTRQHLMFSVQQQPPE